MERYYPGGIGAFVEGFISKYYDSKLEGKCDKATWEILKGIERERPLSDEVVERREEITNLLLELYELEDTIELPEGDYNITQDIPIETAENPDNNDWILNLKNMVYPLIETGMDEEE